MTLWAQFLKLKILLYFYAHKITEDTVLLSPQEFLEFPVGSIFLNFYCVLLFPKPLPENKLEIGNEIVRDGHCADGLYGVTLAFARHGSPHVPPLPSQMPLALVNSRT